MRLPSATLRCSTHCDRVIPTGPKRRCAGTSRSPVNGSALRTSRSSQRRRRKPTRNRRPSSAAAARAPGETMTPESATLNHRGAVRPPAATNDYFLRQGLLKLLAIKDSDVRLLCLEQCRDAIDKSLHAGGAFSATIPLVALHYGGFMNVDVAEPTRRGQD